MNVALLTLVIFGGIGVFMSYLYTFAYLQPGSYLTHPMWLKLPTAVIIPFIILQLLAALGFLIGIFNWILNKPTSGVFKEHTWLLTCVLCLFFIGAILWGPATYYEYRFVSTLSLILVALASIMLLAGAAEEKPIKPFPLFGLMALCVVTVLVDGVIWNARYIKHYENIY